MEDGKFSWSCCRQEFYIGAKLTVYFLRQALGEAEAELAFLNRTGVVDAIMTDDVDALIFGATTVVRKYVMSISLRTVVLINVISLSVGGSLTGNKSNPALRKDGKKGKDHTMLFTADAVRNNPAIQLSRGGMVLFALLVGGDYDKVLILPRLRDYLLCSYAI